MLIGELDHRANAFSIALLLAKVALLAAQGVGSRRRQNDLPVDSACVADPGRAPGTDPADSAGTLLDWAANRLDPDR